MKKIFDFRNSDVLEIKRETKEQSFTITISDFEIEPNSTKLDQTYSLTLKKVNQSSVSKEFTLGTDLIIDSANKTLSIKIDDSIGSGCYKGTLRSSNQDIAYSLNIPIKIETNE